MPAVLAFAFAASMLQCGSDADRRELADLASRFLLALRSPGSVPWEGIFFNLEEAGGAEAVRSLSAVSGIDGARVEKIEFPPSGGAVVTVAIPGQGTVSRIALKARRLGGTWRFDRNVGVSVRLTAPVLKSP